MAKAIFTETLEVGNHQTGYYRKWQKKAEFEGSASELSYLIAETSKRMQLPGTSVYGQLADNSMVDGFSKLLLSGD